MRAKKGIGSKKFPSERDLTHLRCMCTKETFQPEAILHNEMARFK